MKSFCRSLLILAAGWCVLATSAAAAAEPPSVDLFRDKEVTDIFGAIPVQEGGRIKPLENVASYRLLRFRARRSLWLTDTGEMDGKPLEDPVTKKPITKDGDKNVKLGPVEWLLVTWFRPDIARTVPLFKVDNSAAISELGLPAKAKRDQYSFAEIEPARDTLVGKMEQYRAIAPKSQSPEQRMLVQLGANYLDYEMMLGHFDFARSPVGATGEGLPEGMKMPVRLSASLNDLAKALRETKIPPMQIPWFRAFGRAGVAAVMGGNPEQMLRIFPPQNKENKVWSGPGEIILGVLNSEEPATAEQLAWLKAYEDVYLALPDEGKFKAAAQALLTKINEAAAQRGLGEGEHVALERSYMHADYFFYAQWLFLAGFVFVPFIWISPGSWLDKLARIAAWLLLGAATGLAVTGVVVRCLIMERPPITTLYETIIFIGASCALLALVLEVVTRRGLGLLVCAIAGGGCMFLSIQFEASEAADTMQTLQAVLITNFWLATHVPLINLGYAACMLAALLSMLYVPLRLFNLIKAGGDDARLLTRCAYGFIAAGLFFALVGTVLGGIWANYSWGRFWGWDPKENGALMIVLMCLVILHARLGGYIREAGMHCCNLVLGCIVVFSWWGVNQLGVGLHAYGFTEGTWPKIYAFWIVQGVLLIGGVILALSDRANRAKPKQPPLEETKMVAEGGGVTEPS